MIDPTDLFTQILTRLPRSKVHRYIGGRTFLSIEISDAERRELEQLLGLAIPTSTESLH